MANDNDGLGSGEETKVEEQGTEQTEQEVVEDENAGDEQYRAERKAEREARAKQKAEAAAKAGSPDAGTKQTGTTKPTNNGAAKPGVTGAETSEFQKQFETLKKSYDDLRAEFTRRTQGESGLRKEYDALKGQFADLMKQITKKEHDPQQFISELQTKGIEALNPYLEELLKEKETAWEEKHRKSEERAVKLEHQTERMKRMLDTTNYPDFAKLEEKIVELAKNEKTPIDWNLPVGDIYDGLYKLAKESSSEEAVKLAEEAARKEAEAGLAKEAQTGVAGSGTKTGKQTKDLSKLSLADHRAALVSEFGEASEER
jgi:hypothetical protein